MKSQDDDAHRRNVTLIAGVAVVVILGAALWVFGLFTRGEDLNACFASGRRNCAPVQNERPPQVFVPAH